jgi:hypothetical protein
MTRSASIKQEEKKKIKVDSRYVKVSENVLEIFEKLKSSIDE